MYPHVRQLTPQRRRHEPDFEPRTPVRAGHGTVAVTHRRQRSPHRPARQAARADGGAAALFVAPAELGEHWPWPLTPLLGRVVAAWYALFATMLLSCAVALRRPAEAIIAYTTLAAWSVLLLAVPLLHPDHVRGGGPWIALTLALLGLSAYALKLALPDRKRL